MPYPAPTRPMGEDGFNFMERRRPSIAGEGPDVVYGRKNTDDALDFVEFKHGRMPRRESIIPLDLVKEEVAEEVDKDGFKHPRVLKSGEKEGNDSQEATKEASRKEGEQEAAKSVPPKRPIQYQTPYPMTSPAMNYLPPPDYPSPYCADPNYSAQMRPMENGYEAQPSFFNSPFMQASPAFHQTPRQQSEQVSMMMCAGYGGQDEFRLDGGEAPNNANQMWKQPAPTQVTPAMVAPAPVIVTPQEQKPPVEAGPERKIGTLTVSERREKILKYLEKRKRRIWKKKISYDCRKKVADKRLRIKGRFVTREQAYAILGTTAEDLAKNELLRTLVNSNSNCSIITSAQNMKIRNIQTLFMAADKQQLESSKKAAAALEKKEEREREKEKEKKTGAGTETEKGNEKNQDTDKAKEKPKETEKAKVISIAAATLVKGSELKVEILKENERDQTVEIKIETIKKGTR